MGGTESEQSEPCEVEDPQTGQRYLMYRLRIGAWPGSPLVVYECPSCRARCSPDDWSGACRSCKGETRGKRRRRGC
ncbi:MAG TPA: hypothetical protein VIJ94_12310 [Caulobacteraceae bacterium]